MPIKELMELAKKNGEDPCADPTTCFMLLAESKERDPMPSQAESAAIALDDTELFCTESRLGLSTLASVRTCL